MEVSSENFSQESSPSIFEAVVSPTDTGRSTPVLNNSDFNDDISTHVQDAEEKSKVKSDEPSQKKKKKRTRNALDVLLADSDWYITSYEKTSTIPTRQSSIKRRLIVESNLKENEEKLKNNPPKPKVVKARAPPVFKKAKPKIVRNESNNTTEGLTSKPKPKKVSSSQISRLFIEAEYYTRWSFGNSENKDESLNNYTRDKSVRKKPVIYTDSDFPTNFDEYDRKKKRTVPKLFKENNEMNGVHKVKTSSTKFKDKPKKGGTVSKAKTKEKERKSKKKGNFIDSDVGEKQKEREQSENQELSQDDSVSPQESSPEAEYTPDPYEPLSLNEDVEVPLFERRFFQQGIHEKKNPVLSSEVTTIKSCLDVIEANRNRYNDIGFPQNVLRVSNYFFPDNGENFLPLEPKDDEINPFEEIKTSMEIITAFYLSESYKNKVTSEILPAYLQSLQQRDYSAFIHSISDFNSLIKIASKDEKSMEFIAGKRTVSRYALHQFLNQIYTRVVSPEVRKLRNYKAFSNYVYGELLPRFVSEVLHQVEFDHTKKFFDLGSGVGNTVLQAALEFGAESYGCEIMEHASNLTELQLKNFKAKCDLYCIETGPVRFFLKESFVENERIRAILAQCDVILVNNYLFDAALNKDVVALMSDLKPGTKVISLRSLVPPGFTFDTVNIENVLNRMEVKCYEMKENSVSWTHSKVFYYVGTVQEDIVDHYFVDHKVGRTRKKATIPST